MSEADRSDRSDRSDVDALFAEIVSHWDDVALAAPREARGDADSTVVDGRGVDGTGVDGTVVDGTVVDGTVVDRLASDDVPPRSLDADGRTGDGHTSDRLDADGPISDGHGGDRPAPGGPGTKPVDGSAAGERRAGAPQDRLPLPPVEPRPPTIRSDHRATWWGGTARPDGTDAADAVEDHFEPPPPAPLPAGDLQFWGIVLGLCGGPLLLLYLIAFDRDASSLWTAAAILLTLGGFGLLVARQPHRRPDDGDDGARL